MDWHAAWGTTSDWLTKTVPGIIILGLVPNLLILVLPRGVRDVSRGWKRAKADAEARVLAESVLLDESDRALMVACAARIANVAWWSCVFIATSMVAVLAQGDAVPRATLTFFAFFGMVQATRHGRYLHHLHGKYVERPVRAIVKEAAKAPEAKPAVPGGT